MDSRPGWLYVQSAVIPFRRRADRLELLMITSRSGKRWVFPKGVVDFGLSPAASAAKEALEEAGIEGSVSPEPVGRYSYDKWGGTCRVEVFTMEVETIHERWLEQDYRTREWMGPEEAARRAEEADLARLILAVVESIP